MLKVQANSRQIPSNKSYTAEKKYSDLLYGVLQEMSELAEEGGQRIRYIEKKAISFQKLGERIGLTRQTVSTKFKHLISVGLVVEELDKGRYVLKNLDRTISSLVPFETLRKLNNTLSHNSISVFVYLLNRYVAEGERSFIVTLRQIKDFIGQAVTTSSNDHLITDILQVLKLLGLIDYQKTFLEDVKSMYQITVVRNIVKEC